MYNDFFLFMLIILFTTPPIFYYFRILFVPLQWCSLRKSRSKIIATISFSFLEVSYEGLRNALIGLI